MFSGIVEEVGNVLECKDSAGGRRLRIGACRVLEGLSLGDSVSVSGACLTVIQADSTGFSVEAVQETLRRTQLGKLGPDSLVNLEGALRFNDRLGGHLVTGHIDTVATTTRILPEGFSKLISFAVDRQWSPFFVEKGSVTIDGVSLTVAACDAIPDVPTNPSAKQPPFTFSVALIPYTLEHTTLGRLNEGDLVNIETDIIARYVARWLAPNAREYLKLSGYTDAAVSAGLPLSLNSNG